MAIGLKGKTDPAGGRPAEGMEPLEGHAQYCFDATTNLEGDPEGGEEVRAPFNLLVLILEKLADFSDMMFVSCLQWPIPGATPTRARRDASRSPPEAGRPGSDEQLGHEAAISW